MTDSLVAFGLLAAGAGVLVVGLAVGWVRARWRRALGAVSWWSGSVRIERFDGECRECSRCPCDCANGGRHG